MMQRRYWIPTAIALVCALAMAAGQSHDFRVYYDAVNALVADGWDGVYAPHDLTPYKYQPPSLLLFLPLGLLGWPAAKLIWVLLNGAAVWDLQRRLIRFGVPVGAVAVGVLFVLHGISWQIKLGNVTFLMTWLLVVVATTTQPWPRAAGAAVLIILKPFWLALLPVFVLAGDRRGLLRVTAGVAVLSLLPFIGGIEAGLHAYQAWIPTLSDPMHAHNYPKNDNQSVFAILYRYRGAWEGMVMPLWGALVLAVGLGWVAGARWISGARAVALATFGVVPVILWVGPLSWIHHQILLWPLCAWLWARRDAPGMRVGLVVVWVLLNGTGELFLGRDGFETVSQLGLPVLAYPLLLWLVWRSRDALLTLGS